jgi:choline dehydrogenase-like flavoprotein
MLAAQLWRYTRTHRAYHPSRARVSVIVVCEQEPLGEGTIRLSDTRDAAGIFRTALDWRVSDAEIRSMALHTQRVQRALENADMARVEPAAGLLDDPDAFRGRCEDSNHHMGGARMASAPAEGLVDTQLRLHGTDNAYVCSAAVFPTSSCFSPTHTVVALGMRLADSLTRAGRAESVSAIP